jgi:hypothetical protein
MNTGWRGRIRLVGIGVLSGVVIGLPASLVARLNMAAVALEIGQNPAITIATLNIVLDVLGPSIIAGLIYVAIRQHLPGKNDVVKGLEFGALLLLLLLLFSPNGFDGDLPLAPVLGTSLFAILCLAYGIFMVKVVSRLDHSFPAPRLHPAYIAGYAPLVFLGGFSILIFLVTDVVPFVASGFRLVGMP